ncbi:hypothetical protein [Paractinoplanes maris]|uniref:hypothetical protein n=1 Tax=Paractinoplanes maris TaxID=1734446 RepID=UPI002020952F|nr:hypothetical protein [Actinoplanes maris]
MPHKTLYVAPSDESLWAAAQRVADKAGTSVSRVVAEALKNDLPRAAAELEQQKAEKVDQWAEIAA